jgi:hypothetical protein
VRLRGLACLPLLALVGCAAQPVGPPESLPGLARVDVGGTCLDQRGFSQGPADRLCLPADSTVSGRFESPRTLSAWGPVAEGPAILAFLAANLPTLGWKITAAGETGLIFELGPWTGSFVLGTTDWGLAVRAE